MSRKDKCVERNVSGFHREKEWFSHGTGNPNHLFNGVVGMKNERYHSVNLKWNVAKAMFGSIGRAGLLCISLLLANEGTALAVDHESSSFPDRVGTAESRTKVARGTIQQALKTQTQRVDRQIADFEARFVPSNQGKRQAPVPTDAESRNVSAPQTTPVENLTTAEEDVQRLDETVVRDTYLDPFDEEGGEELVEDPWEPMNTKVFSFNVQVDRYVLKPLASGYAWILPDPVERAIGRAINNIRFVPRTMNNLFQQKWSGASMEAGRFLLNSTVGIAGFFDVADTQFGLKPTNPEDLGQTLAMYGVRSGPYLVLPLLPPTTVRDGAGLVGDMLMDPLSYFIPFVPQASLNATDIVNDRSQNMELYEGVESSTVDLYGAVRSGHKQRRSRAIKAE